MLFDTDVLIWALRGNARAAAAIDRAETLELSVVSYMELIRGVRDKRELHATKAALARLDFQILDALIAATGVENGVTLCTANAKDYRPIAELELKVFRP